MPPHLFEGRRPATPECGATCSATQHPTTTNKEKDT